MIELRGKGQAMKVYIKFKHPDDIYAINPTYDLRSGDEFTTPRICPRCGDTLYIPVELPNEAEISQAMGVIHRPFPIDNPSLIIRDDPGPMVLGVYKSISYPEQLRLRQFCSIALVDEKGFEMLIKGVSRKPIKHECEGRRGKQ